MADDGEECEQDSLEDDKKEHKRVTLTEIRSLWELLCDSEIEAGSISLSIVETIFTALGQNLYEDQPHGKKGEDFGNVNLYSQSTNNDEQKTGNYFQEEKGGQNCSAIDVSDQQTLALKCFARVLQLVQLAHPHECQMDSPSLIKRFLGIIKLRGGDSTHTFSQTVALLDAIPHILVGEDTQVLQAIFVGVGCFEDIVTALSSLPSDQDQQNMMFISCIQALTSITVASRATQEVFKASVGYNKLYEHMKRLTRPSQGCVLALLDWVVEGGYRDGNRVINNVDVILMMLDWLQTANVEMQRFASEHIKSLCQLSTHNAMLCSVSGVFGKVISILDTSHQSMDSSWAVSLIGILEAVGFHSVDASELKQMISLFRPLEDGTQIKFTHRLLQALVKMSCGGGRTRAKHYFDLHHKSACINVPSIQKWIGAGFTFFAWLCLEPQLGRERKSSGHHRPLHRRQLYSFITNSGVGVEAFLARDGELVVATSNKKEYTTVTVPGCQLMDQQWHSLSIAHVPSRRPFGHSTVSVYVDGNVKLTCPMKFHSFSEEITSCFIGSGISLTNSLHHTQHPPVSKTSLRFPFTRSSSLDSHGSHTAENYTTVTLGTQDSVWGVPTSLQGQLGPVCVFYEGLAEYYHSALYTAGPNDLDVFQPLDVSGSSQCSLSELSCKLVLYYNAKAGRDLMCIDLTPPQPGHTPLPGRLTGHRCVTWDIKDVIQALGGVEIFLPLFEVFHFKNGDEDMDQNGNQPSDLETTEDKTTVDDRHQSLNEDDNTLQGSTETGTNSSRSSQSEPTLFPCQDTSSSALGDSASGVLTPIQNEGEKTCAFSNPDELKRINNDQHFLNKSKDSNEVSIPSQCDVQLMTLDQHNKVLRTSRNNQESSHLSEREPQNVFSEQFSNSSDNSENCGSIGEQQNSLNPQQGNTLLEGKNSRQIENELLPNSTNNLVTLDMTSEDDRSRPSRAESSSEGDRRFPSVCDSDRSRTNTTLTTRSRFSVLSNASSFSDPQDAHPEEWTIIDKSRDMNYFRKEIARICDLPQCSGISLLLYLILSIFKEDYSSESSHAKRVPFLSHMLETCDSRLVDANVLKSLQAMVECVTNESLLSKIYHHLLFNFRIWTSSNFNVRIGHIQYLSTIIKDSPSYFRLSFGVQFFLDVIRMYYAGEHESMCKTAESKRAGFVDLTEEEVRIIRASLLGLVKFYLKEKPTRVEATCVVEYTQGVRDSEQVVEILDMMISLCSKRSTSKMVKRLSEPEHVCVFVSLLIKHKPEHVRLAILKLMAAIVTSPKVPDANRDAWRLKEVGMVPLAEALSSEVTEFTVLGLLELGVTEISEAKGVYLYGHYDVVLAVVNMVMSKGLATKLLVSQMILRSLDASRQSHIELAKEPAWHDTLLRLLTKQPPSQGPDVDVVSSTNQEAAGARDLIDTVLEIVFRVMWRGIQGHGKHAWKDRGQAITAISTIASTETFLCPSRILERTLLELCLEGEVEDIKRSGQTGVSETENALMIMRLVEDFLFTSESFTGEDSEDCYTWSVKLVELVADLLEALNVWVEDESEEKMEWEEMAQLGGRILLGFISREEPTFCATASSKLSKLLKARTINSQVEVCFVLGNLYKAFVTSRQKEGCRNFTFIIPIIRLVLLKYREQLPLAIYVPTFTAPDRSHPKFEEEFIELAEKEEFKALMRQQILPGIKQYESNFAASSMLSGRFWMDCLTGLQSSLRSREQQAEASREKYEVEIIEAAKRALENQQEHEKSVVKQRQQQSTRNTRDWSLTKRRLTSERAPWAKRSPEEAYWKLSTTETFQRMRLKLTHNYNFNSHMDASNTRDNVAPESRANEMRSESVPVRVAREAVVLDSVDGLEEEEFIMSVNSASPPLSPKNRAASMTEKVLVEVDCEFITLMDIVPGKLKVSTTHVYFTANRNGDGNTTAAQDFVLALTELREVHLRRHNLRRSALEFFLVDQINYFVNFSKEDRNTVYKKIMLLRPPNLYYIGARSPAQLLKASGLTERWIRRDISNFEYLMQLNTIAGRTYNDLSQYPVFPWILMDYESDELDLNNPAIYRDLSKPVGVLNPSRVYEVLDRYKYFDDPTGTIAKFHYGTHYSNSASVLFYLLRVEPFTTLHISLQNGRFDCSDRQLYSISALWNSQYFKGSDVKELIPEFFYFPEFLENSNRFDLGRHQNGGVVDHVALPPWAKTTEEFVYKHRKALESEHVSMNIHKWIDLIFGYKQRGPAAVEALNVFYYCTYEGAVDLDAITDKADRIANEGMINNFGQTPSQLLTAPHPQRMTAEEAAAHKFKAMETTSTSRPLANVFDFVDKLKAYFVVVSDVRDPLVFAAVPKVQARLLIHHGMPDSMVTISRSGILGNQDWLPYSKTKSRPFTFELDPALSSVKLRRTVAGPFIPDLPVSPRLFAITHDARLVITAGHWDNTIRVFTPKGKMTSRIHAHSDVVTCLSLDRDGHHLITGSRDTTCRVWAVTHVGGWAGDVDNTPLQNLYGHDREVTCVALSWELDMAVSGSRDGTCIVYTARKGDNMRTLRPIGNNPASAPSPCRVTSVELSEYGSIVIFCHNREERALCQYSINGRLLADEKALKDDVIDMVICGEFLVTGGSAGMLSIRALHSFKQMKSMNLLVPITSVSLAKDNSHIFVTLCDGKLIVIAVDST